MCQTPYNRGAIPVAFIIVLLVVVFLFVVIPAILATALSPLYSCSQPVETEDESTTSGQGCSSSGTSDGSDGTEVTPYYGDDSAYSYETSCEDLDLQEGNLLANGSAEEGTLNWTGDESWTAGREITPCEGRYHFFAGVIAQGTLQQTIDLQASFLETDLNSGTLNIRTRSFHRSYDNFPVDDVGTVTLTFKSYEGDVLSSLSSIPMSNVGEWLPIDLTLGIPAGGRYITFTFDALRLDGSDNDAYMDNALMWVEPDLDEDGDGYYAHHGDCDDLNAASNPSAVEVCDLADNDCDGMADEGIPGTTTWYEDGDGDGYGNPDQSLVACTGPVGYTFNNLDCDDTNSEIHPNGIEICNNLDDNCNGEIDEGGSAAVLWYPDTDGDQFGDPANSVLSCNAPDDGYTLDHTDCDDSRADTYPGAPELCDQADNNCNSVPDADESEFADLIQYEDLDEDGFGTDVVNEGSCLPGYALLSGDCNDQDATIHPDAPEVWGNDVDENCDGELPSADIYVNPAGVAPVQGAPVYVSIPAALDAAVAGQTIAVFPGTYLGSVDFRGKNVRLMSMEGPENTILDANGEGSVVTFIHNETADAILEGFTLTHGSGSTSTTCGFSPGFRYGGGVCIREASPTLKGNMITHNEVAGSGGGVYSEEGSPSLIGNILSHNSASYDGGGINFSSGTLFLLDNLLEDNLAQRSGGALMLFDSAADIVGNQFRRNSALGQVYPGGASTPVAGGGVFISGTSDPVLYHNIFSSNTASAGGAIQVATQEAPSPTLIYHNTLVANVASTGSGGGLFVTEGAVEILGSLFAYNIAPVGANVGGDSALAHYSLFWMASGESGVSAFTPGETCVLADPLFVNGPADGNTGDDNYHLVSGSPAIDAADPDATWQDSDGSRADIGAYGGPEELPR